MMSQSEEQSKETPVPFSRQPRNPNHDPTSPYYLHPSDNPGAVITSIVFGDENYDLWGKAVRNLFMAKNKLGFIDGSISRRELKEGEEESIEFLLTVNAWHTCNSMLMAWLLNVIKPSLHSSVGYAVTAKTMWDDLKERYGV